MSDDFLVKAHENFILRLLKVLPSSYIGFQNSRPTVLFFLISSLDLLNKLNEKISNEKKKKLIDYLYNLMIDSNSHFPDYCYGFRGSKFFNENKIESISNYCEYESSHIAQTYTALCCLLILDDDLSRIDTASILRGVQLCQKEDGSFCAFGSKNSENDMRFVFCAVAICFILHDFSYINVTKVKSFIRLSANFDGGIGQGPKFESHGGSTYCAIASLYLLGNLWDNSVLSKHQIERLKNWIILKQNRGFHGRVNKEDDSCYAFWNGATLAMLNSRYLVDEISVRSFLMNIQDERIGGFSKYIESVPDILHTYFSIAGLSIFGEPFLNPIYSPLNISRRAYEHLMRLHNKNNQ